MRFTYENGDFCHSYVSLPEATPCLRSTGQEPVEAGVERTPLRPPRLSKVAWSEGVSCDPWDSLRTLPIKEGTRPGKR